jgi:hypothetical protein
MRLARTQRGTMIHDRNCRYARNALPWVWADDKSAFEVYDVKLTFGYRMCGHCKPLGV